MDQIAKAIWKSAQLICYVWLRISKFNVAEAGRVLDYGHQNERSL